MGNDADGLELRCSQCGRVVDTCDVCGASLGIGPARCALKGDADARTHHHAECEAERKRRLVARLVRPDED